MAVYVPSDQPQTLGVKKDVNHFVTRHVQEFRDFGPPPPNYYAARYEYSHKARMIYADHATSSNVTTKDQGGSLDHPFSPAGMMSGKKAPTFGLEPVIVRPQSPGFFDPPMTYRSGQVLWKYHKNWQSALAAAMTTAGIKVNNRAMGENDVNQKLAELLKNPVLSQELSQPLYHPADRDMAIFRDEPHAALLARHNGARLFSLAIVCPYVRADGVGYGRIYDVKNRPPIIVRWSQGRQGLHQPLMLMCIPKSETNTGRESFYKDVDWFNMEPAPNTDFATRWGEMWNSGGNKFLVQLSTHFRFPTFNKIEIFVWVIVFLHRRIALGAQILDTQLGAWIYQYGEHLRLYYKTAKAQSFTFNAKMKYTGREVDYQQLTAWVLNPAFSDKTLGYVKKWDDAVQSMIEYNLDMTDAKWNTMRRLFEDARKPPM